MTLIRIAIQKSGRLNEDSIRLLKECDIQFQSNASTLITTSNNFPIEILYLRDDDIPTSVSNGTADIGIVGKNVVEEKDDPVITIEALGFGKCRLSLAVPKNKSIQNLSDLNQKKIATSYPNILRKFLQKEGINANLCELSGSVEIAPGIGLSDAICDLVSSGSTLMQNGLEEIATIFHSEALLIQNPNLSEAKVKLVSDLLFRIRSAQKAKNYRYILLNAPDDSLDTIISLLPGMKSPTIMPLAQKGWSSLHSVISVKEFWTVIENLKKAGAQGILVIPIEKMIL